MIFTSKLRFVKALKDKLNQLGYSIGVADTKHLVDWIESVVTVPNTPWLLSDEDKFNLIKTMFESDHDQSLKEDGEKYRKLKDLINQ